MTTVSDILKFMEQVAPDNLKMEWDKVGLNCGRASKPVTKVLVALDPFPHVCEEAKNWGAELLLTHHALIWNSGFITDEATWSRSTLYLIENGIAHINAHTNYDCAPGGVNDVLAQTLGLEDITTVDSMGGTLLRCGYVKEQKLADFMDTVKARLGSKTLKYVDGGKAVRKVAVGGGACAGGAEDAIKAGCDTFVTSDIGYNRFWDAYEAGLNMIDAGHFHTENPSMLVLVEKLRAAFPEIQVKISEKHTDCAKFY